MITDHAISLPTEVKIQVMVESDVMCVELPRVVQEDRAARTRG